MASKLDVEPVTATATVSEMQEIQGVAIDVGMIDSAGGIPRLAIMEAASAEAKSA